MAYHVAKKTDIKAETAKGIGPRMGFWGKVLVAIFIAGNIFNVGVAYHCWTRWCYPLYVWISLCPALSAGLHFGIGGMLKCNRAVGIWLCAFQAFFTSLYWYSFKSNDDILKLFAGTRYFEIFALAPHFVAYINGRCALYFSDPKAVKSPWMHAIGLECTPHTKTRQHQHLETFFALPEDKTTAWMELHLFENHHFNHCLTALYLLFQMQVVLFLMMFGVHVFTPWTTASHLIVYGPALLVLLILIRDRYSHVVVWSLLLGISHGLTHLKYPFLDEVIGVRHEVDVWQDQVVHALQAVLFAYIFCGKLIV